MEGTVELSEMTRDSGPCSGLYAHLCGARASSARLCVLRTLMSTLMVSPFSTSSSHLSNLSCSICGRLHLGPEVHVQFFLFSIFHFENLSIPASSSFSFTFSPQTDLSSLSLLFILEDFPPLLLSPSDNFSFSSFYLPKTLVTLFPQKHQEKDRWKEVEFILHEMRGKKIKEVQVLCYADTPLPSITSTSTPSSSPPTTAATPSSSPFFTYHSLLGGIGLHVLPHSPSLLPFLSFQYARLPFLEHEQPLNS
jgi:hypothetical protein